MLCPRSEESFERLLSALRGSRVVAMACDTIYGFVGRAPDTEDAILQMKGRGLENPFLRLISHDSMLQSKGVLLPQRSDLLDLWPGPYTFILPLVVGGTSAFRVPGDARLRSLISKVGAPLFSTSVNRTGQAPLNDPVEIEAEFGSRLALVEDSGVRSEAWPSTVVDLSVDPPQILRQGAGLVPPSML